MCGSAVLTTAMSSISTAVARHTTASVPRFTSMALAPIKLGEFTARSFGEGRCGRVTSALRPSLRALLQQCGQPRARDLGLRDEAARAAALDAGLEVRAVAARGENHRRRLRLLRREPLRDLEAVDPRHVDIEQDEPRPQVTRGDQCLLAVRGLSHDLVALVFEHESHGAPEAGVVVDDQ